MLCFGGEKESFMFVVLYGSHGIETTFLKFYLWSPGTVLIPIINLNVLNLRKKERIYERERKISFMHTKNI